jgi:hypothetical protein
MLGELTSTFNNRKTSKASSYLGGSKQMLPCMPFAERLGV